MVDLAKLEPTYLNSARQFNINLANHQKRPGIENITKEGEKTKMEMSGSHNKNGKDKTLLGHLD